ncbi:MAG: 4'-phosphopantetheinyl transferase superfamily protein [Armatimonadota bacterium]
MMTGVDCVSPLDENRWTPALRRLVFTDSEHRRFSVETAPVRLLNQLFAIKEACVKACVGAALPPQIEVAVGMREARIVSRRGEDVPDGGCAFTVSTSSSKSGLTLAVAFRVTHPGFDKECEA